MWQFAALAAHTVAGGLQYNQNAKAQQRQTKAQEKYNETVRATSARQLTEINIQRSVARSQTAQALDAARQQGANEASARNLQSAAADTMGASVEQGLLDVQQQLDTAQGNLMRNAEVQELSFDSAVQNTVDTAKNSIQELSNPLGTDWAGLGSLIGQAGTTIAANKAKGLDWKGSAITPQKAAPITAAVGTPTNLSTRLRL